MRLLRVFVEPSLKTRLILKNIYKFYKISRVNILPMTNIQR